MIDRLEICALYSAGSTGEADRMLGYIRAGTDRCQRLKVPVSLSGLMYDDSLTEKRRSCLLQRSLARFGTCVSIEYASGIGAQHDAHILLMALVMQYTKFKPNE